MKRVVNSEEMKFCDSSTINHFGVPSIVLMERAALSIVSHMPASLPAGASVLIACGNGNNGADGLAVARLLHQKGYRVTAAKIPGSGRCTEENQMQLDIANKYKIRVVDSIPEQDAYDYIIDALFGVGLSRPPQGIYAQWIHALNKKRGYKIAVDIPSGVCSDTGRTYPASFQADLTVTFAYRKIGQILYPGCEKCGKVVTAEIGITDESWLSRSPSCFMLDKGDLKELLPHRPKRSNKGTFGKVLVIAGSTNMAGAALFCAKAAYRTGCGLVKIYTPGANRVILQNAIPEAVLSSYDHDFDLDHGQKLDCDLDFDHNFDHVKTESMDHLRAAVKWADVIAIGPGIGTDSRACRILKQVLQEAEVPLVLDADALNIIAAQPELLSCAKSQPGLILTPHLGEMARLTGRTISEIQDTLLGTAKEFAARHQLVLVLKDAVTVTASPSAVYLNTSGCSAMAKGGSGDVLTGMIAALLAQGMEAEQAAAAAVYLHGLAGEAASRQKGEYSVLATDLIDAVGDIMKRDCIENICGMQ